MENVIEKVRNYTKSSTERLEAMETSLKVIEKDNIPGDIVEIGVWRAGNIMMARLLAPTRVCWLYDTFDGMTEPDHELDIKVYGELNRAIDKYNSKKAAGKKWNAYPLTLVQKGFKDVGISTTGMHFIEGPIEETIHDNLPDQISILRLDVDWYHPTKISLEKLYPLLVPNGFLIVDDYGHWAGCRKAIDDYFINYAPPYIDVDYTCRVYRKCL